MGSKSRSRDLYTDKSHDMFFKLVDNNDSNNANVCY